MDERAAVRRAWADIESWLRAHAPERAAEIKAGASAAAIADIEREVGAPLPEGLRISLELHDGEPELDYLWLGTAMILRKHAQRTQAAAGQKAAVKTHPAVKPLVWCRGWVPFAQDSGANYYCVDLDPGDEGKAGQVIRWGWESQWGQTTEFDSYEAWLCDYRDRLLAGSFLVEDGFLWPKP